MKIALIVVAAGRGTRLGADVAKVLIPVGGISVLERTLHCFAGQEVISQRILVASQEVAVALGLDWQRMSAREVVTKDFASGAFQIVPGGEERRDSVMAGLAAVESDVTHVLIHDGARPFVRELVISGVIEGLRSGHSAVVPAVPVTDTIRQTVGDRERQPSDAVFGSVLDRQRLRACQTPQGFDLACLKDALARCGHSPVTDEAVACELAGVRVLLTAGSEDNIKITTPLDLKLAELIVQGRELLA